MLTLLGLFVFGIALMLGRVMWLWADVTVTAANVANGAGSTLGRATAGVAITAGQTIYIDASGNAQLAKADTLVHAACSGIAVDNAAAGQQVLNQQGGNINPGGTLVVGGVYVVSPTNAGGIAPIGDIGAGNYTTILGYATTTSNLVLNILPTGVAHA